MDESGVRDGLWSYQSSGSFKDLHKAWASASGDESLCSYVSEHTGLSLIDLRKIDYLGGTIIDDGLRVVEFDGSPLVREVWDAVFELGMDLFSTRMSEDLQRSVLRLLESQWNDFEIKRDEGHENLSARTRSLERPLRGHYDLMPYMYSLFMKEGLFYHLNDLTKLLPTGLDILKIASIVLWIEKRARQLYVNRLEGKEDNDGLISWMDFQPWWRAPVCNMHLGEITYYSRFESGESYALFKYDIIGVWHILRRGWED
ncbi:MAG: hypothetical protein AAGM67_08555 [Bacteroidota bacterium]